MDDKEVFNPQSGERIALKKPKKFWKDWRFYVYTIIAVMLAIVSVSSMVTACAAINAGVGQSEPVSSQYKVRHNAQITTANGGYTGYRFTIATEFSDFTGHEPCYKVRIFNVDPSTYTLSGRYESDFLTATAGWGGVTSAISAWWGSANPSTSSGLAFLIIEGRSDIWASGSYGNWYYYSFKTSQAGSFQETFIETANYAGYAIKTTSNNYAWSGVARHPTITTSQQTLFYLPSGASSNYVFQDVGSYYKELGHTDGYAEGYDAGETHAYDTLQTGIAFETYGMYADAKITLVADRNEGSYYYMDLFDYVTDTNIERSVYVLYIQNASNSTWLGYVQDVNVSDSSGATYDIGSFTGASSTTDVVFTALMDRNLWEGAYITSFHGHAEAVNNAFWFTGGSYAATQQIYQDGYGEGYDVGRNDGYDIGYDAGVQVGRTQGLNEAEPESLTNTLVAVFQQPFNQLYRFFNFNVLGLNVLGIVSGLISVLVVLKVFKKLYK